MRSTDERDRDSERHREIVRRLDGIIERLDRIADRLDRGATPAAYRDVPDLVPPLRELRPGDEMRYGYPGG